MSRTASITVNLDALTHNLATIREKTPKSRLMAMIKANAYGHGLCAVAHHLDQHVDSFGVAIIEEALELRRAHVTSPITLMQGPFQADEIMLASEHGFDMVIHTEEQIQWLKNTPLIHPINVWLKIDTGMGRLGFSPDTAMQSIEQLERIPYIRRPIGLMTHFAQADQRSSPYNQQQIDTFLSCTKGYPGPISLANSAAILTQPELAADWVRPGLMLYGISPLEEHTGHTLGLQPVMTLSAQLIAKRQLKKGDYIGYDSRYRCPENMPVGVIALGYGDGYPVQAPDGTPVLVNDIQCNIVGRVSMDMVTLDLRQCPQAKVGDTVTLWGPQLPVETVAQAIGLIPYALVCGIRSRVAHKKKHRHITHQLQRVTSSLK